MVQRNYRPLVPRFAVTNNSRLPRPQTAEKVSGMRTAGRVTSIILREARDTIQAGEYVNLIFLRVSAFPHSQHIRGTGQRVPAAAVSADRAAPCQRVWRDRQRRRISTPREWLQRNYAARGYVLVRGPVLAKMLDNVSMAPRFSSKVTPQNSPVWRVGDQPWA